MGNIGRPGAPPGFWGPGYRPGLGPPIPPPPLTEGNLGRPGWAPGRWPPGFRPPLGPVVAPAPVVFITELSAWLEGKLGVAVRPCRLPRNALNWPLLTFSSVGRETPFNLAGPSGASCLHVQFDCWSDDFYQAELLGEKLRLALEGYRGPVGRSFVQGALPGRVLNDFFPNDSTDDDQGIYRTLCEYQLWHSDPVPIR